LFSRKSSKLSPRKKPQPNSRRWLVRAARLFSGYVVICILLLWQQQRLLFWPSSTLEHTPGLYNLRYQDVWLPVSTKDGNVERIHGWWIPAEQATAPVLLYFHHNAVNIGANVSQARKFQQLGCSVLLVDYRGFGLSEGSFPTESQVYEDAQAAWVYLTRDRQIPARQIFIYGHSVGGAVAIDLAAKHPEAAALIVQSSFTSLRDMTKRFGLFWVLPIDLILRQRFDSLQKIKSLKMPVLFIHGTADPQIPVAMGQALYDATPEPKQILIIPQAGHDNNMADPYYQVVKQFTAAHRKP
jgi:hypothetical protein